jgi:His-Xaa-Ser repeat protein HxsA
MKAFKTSLLLFLSSLQTPIHSAISDAKPVGASSDPPQEPVSLRPLNSDLDNKFAGHRSHSSHRSHRSHRSSSGGSYSAPAESTPAPAYSAPPASSPPAGARGLTSSGTVGSTSPATNSSATKVKDASTLNLEEKKKLQVMRVQIALSTLGLYAGQIDGVIGAGTQEALKRFQRLKNINPDGSMSTQTLNALNVPAVQ